jgi:hypothetical protein
MRIAQNIPTSPKKISPAPTPHSITCSHIPLLRGCPRCPATAAATLVLTATFPLTVLDPSFSKYCPFVPVAAVVIAEVLVGSNVVETCGVTFVIVAALAELRDLSIDRALR